MAASGGGMIVSVLEYVCLWLRGCECLIFKKQQHQSSYAAAFALLCLIFSKKFFKKNCLLSILLKRILLQIILAQLSVRLWVIHWPLWKFVSKQHLFITSDGLHRTLLLDFFQKQVHVSQQVLFYLHSCKFSKEGFD